ncbi:WecB/TagA/CpsF family glycosyltransferase [Aquimarina rubra]|uniref:WecB/TagA/CpsF family glycosyltransferase n=1 Tax=Aquimarina rubra TaxID=1920033 RepID=A0ABW5LHE3_9FLAO
MNKLKKLVLNSSAKEQVDIIGINTFLNPYSYLKYRENPDLFNKFNKVYIDGILLVIWFRLFGIKVKRTSFDMTSLAPKVFEFCSVNNKSIYFIGSTDSAINLFVNEVSSKYYNLKILGYRNGYFDNEQEKRNVLTLIKEKNPDFIVVGMGTPFQEEFLLSLKELGWKGSGFTCGGFIHQTAQGIQYYPTVFDKYNLRWLYRIIDEPYLIKRYFIYYPKSLFLFIYDMIFKR